MEFVITISQAFLYVCFSVLLGSFLLLIVPNDYRPNLKISKKVLLICAITLPIFAFIPVLNVILYMSPRFGFLDSFKLVLTTYTVGTAWDFTLLLSIVLILHIIMVRTLEEKTIASLGTVLTIGLILTIAWSSHAGALDLWMGIISDFLHLTAISVWVGILLIIGWCSNNHQRWREFLNWFSFVAFGCFVTTAISGLLLMDVIVDEYISSWMISYGQGLLLKHLFLLPLIFYALVNSFIVKSKIAKDPLFNPIPWIRIESFILLTIFTITAAFSQHAPPHGNYLSNEAVSPLFRLFHDDIITSSNTIGFVVNGNTVAFFFVSVLLIGLMIFALLKKLPIVISFLLSGLLVMSVYLMLMVTIVIR
ncbi:copper resistance D family protein [Lysinibacillus antri]|uniref:Copper resistance protein D domain-containing protein n=1 Tax=Lysinibacillus antri TaxID=2498145 RepID=A0A3S0RKY0_9BACI|nr:CopD family protein [Lysinibacillus antri]RUL55600.1 hypothetical protein EK386_04550 [Lysinibacillus antri]